MEYYLLIGLSVLLLGGLVWWYIHRQRQLKLRAFLMREALRNHDYTFRLSTRGLPAGERAMQELLNDMGQEIHRLMAQQEVTSWQRLTRVLTHEIMNATAPIASITQTFLERPDVKGTPLEEGIRAIRDTSSGLNAFVESYRKFMQLQKPHPVEVQLSELVESVVALYSTLTWHTDIASISTVYVDANLLRQVLTNLVKNAVEAGASMVDIRWLPCSPEARGVMLAVSNDGQPIPAEIRNEIFVPFFTTKRHGSGIGLALSRQMMVIQDGDLQLADTPVSGYHTSFIITLTNA